MCPSTVESDTSSLQGVSYLFGHPIAHSMSPLLHNTVYKALGLSRAQIPLPSTDLNDLLVRMKDPKFIGASVTMPHKIAILPHLDQLTSEAREVGACNTIFTRPSPSNPNHRLLCGTNTDVIGIREAFLRNLPPSLLAHLKNRPALVVGGGGAARSAVYALHLYFNCQVIYVINRDVNEVETLKTTAGVGCEILHVASERQAEEMEVDMMPGAVVACVPDFTPVTEDECVARRVLEVMLRRGNGGGAVLEMCYHPNPTTQIVDLARREEWAVILGTEAMIWQGLEQERYWTGLELEELPVEEVKRVVEKALTKALL